MSRKNDAPLMGYEGQLQSYTLADGTELSAGELVAKAVKRYHDANPGLDESQVPLAWNNLEDARRRDWCEDTLEGLNAEQEAGSAATDAVNVLDVAGDIAAKQLGDELLDTALSELRILQRPWTQMNPDQQDEILERLTKRVRAAVSDTIRLLATRGAHTIECELEQITIKKGAKAVLSIGKGQLGDDLVDSVGQAVLLVVGPALKGADAIEKPKPDDYQRTLDLSLGNGDPGTVQHSDPED